tara:strand:+ start:201 stop:629 length:429 start_codon:yes stop_codon:yes gene_type:complete
MFNLFNKENQKSEETNIVYTKIGALLFHAAKIDENITNDERSIIKKALLDLGANETNIVELVEKAESKEKDSNQILEFTKEIKNLDNKKKELIIECLWNIIYSDGLSDIYETNLMRRISGLLYLDAKVVGNIKEKVKRKFSK